jgi:hypothetical protein
MQHVDELVPFIASWMPESIRMAKEIYRPLRSALVMLSHPKNGAAEERHNEV